MITRDIFKKIAQITRGSEDPEARRIRRLRSQRGATMVSVMLLSVSMMTVSLLVVKAAQTDRNEASALYARERALAAAQTATELAAIYYRTYKQNTPTRVDASLNGYYPPGDKSKCEDLTKDCVPGGDGTGTTPLTGQRNQLLPTGLTDCNNQPCMRPGAIAFLPDTTTTDVPWVDVPLSSLIAGGDPEARVTVWIRNNASEALGEADGYYISGSWAQDIDRRVVITASARLRHTSAAVEQEFQLMGAVGPATWLPPSADLGKGSGHNNDNAAVDICESSYATP